MNNRITAEGRVNDGEHHDMLGDIYVSQVREEIASENG